MCASFSWEMERWWCVFEKIAGAGFIYRNIAHRNSTSKTQRDATSDSENSVGRYCPFGLGAGIYCDLWMNKIEKKLWLKRVKTKKKGNKRNITISHLIGLLLKSLSHTMFIRSMKLLEKDRKLRVLIYLRHIFCFSSFFIFMSFFSFISILFLFLTW